MRVHLFIHTKDTQDFDTFSMRIFNILNIEIKETRYSENAPDGRYVYGEVLGLRVTLEEADDSDFADYKFLISFRPQIDWATADPQCLDGFADILARHFARNGMKIARPLNFGKAGTARIEYSK